MSTRIVCKSLKKTVEVIYHSTAISILYVFLPQMLTFDFFLLFFTTNQITSVYFTQKNRLHQYKSKLFLMTYIIKYIFIR